MLGSTEDMELRAASLRLLASVGTAEHLPTVRKWLGPDEPLPVRLAAIRALGRFGGREDLPPLEKTAREDPSPWVAIAAARALKEGGGAASLEAIAGSEHPRSGTRTPGDLGVGVVVSVAFALLALLNGMVLTYFLAINLVYIVTSAKALQVIWQYRQRLERSTSWTHHAPWPRHRSPSWRPRTTRSSRAWSRSDRPYARLSQARDHRHQRRFQDGTVDRLITAFELVPRPRLATAEIATAARAQVYQSRAHPNLWVVDKENGGKADALNAGFNYCNTPLLCAVDADTMLERHALTRIVRPFLEDDRTVAVGGKIRVVNDCTVRSGIVTDARLPKNFLAALQTVEYLRAFLVGRVGWAAFNASLVISGAFGLFHRASVVDAGGYGSERTTERPSGKTWSWWSA